jgi:hypothetical protein
VRVHLAAEHALELELAYAGLEFAGVAFDIARRGLIALAFRQFQQLCGITDGAAGAIDLAQLAYQPRALAPELLGAFG